ncbi:MAG: FRG domain-containing protein [Planctomycetaceae bacterium]|nr:FRG domain-containing protein [Planctomycetaceae bacterium]
MTIETIHPDDPRLRLPAFHNIYPVFNEVHPTGGTDEFDDVPFTNIFLDHNYGRVFTPERSIKHAIYGRTEKMNYYVSINGLNIVDELRVPYRRIPIFSVDDLSTISVAVKELAATNKNHTLLLRGQGKTYMLKRSAVEKELLYGEEVNEPSFLPSFLRANFDELTLQSIWHNQAALLLNDIGFDYQSILPESQMRDYWNDVTALRRTSGYDGFALGLAQHYGLPSVGLDLTDELNVAAWFALYSITIDDYGRATCAVGSEDATPTVFVFRCPYDTVFNYRAVRPKQFPNGRPDRQCAWFAHVGWGAAENQMGSYLMCGFRLKVNVSDQLPSNYSRYLFPKTEDDLILQFFLTMKGKAKYEGEAQRALQRIYHFD